MPSLAWLAVAIVSGVLAYVVGWTAWQGYQARERRDTNTERYLQWRGRADRRPASSLREGMTFDERRRILGGVALGILALVALLAFFATS